MLDFIRRTGIGNRLRATWRHEIDEAMKPLRKDLQRIAEELEQLRTALEDTAARADLGDQASTQLKLMLKLNEDQKEAIEYSSDPDELQKLIAQRSGAALRK